VTITLFIILVTVIASIGALNNHRFMEQWVFKPHLIHHKPGEWYRFFTCGLLHADYVHLFVNIFVLYSFGSSVEKTYGHAFHRWGPWLFALLYVSSIGFANIVTYYKERNNPGYSALGASGAVSAVLFTSILFSPFDEIYLYGLLKVKAVYIGVLYLIYSWYMGRQTQDNVNHDAHFYGALYGIFFTISCRPQTAVDFYHKVQNQFS
jgi:membrane associated rhomboid family serine protease